MTKFTTIAAGTLAALTLTVGMLATSTNEAQAWGKKGWGPAIGLGYMLAASRVRVFITTRRARRRVNQVAGTALIGAGVTVAVT